MKTMFVLLVLGFLISSALAHADKEEGTDFYNKCREGVIPMCSQLHAGYFCCPDDIDAPIRCYGLSYAVQDDIDGHWYCQHESR